MFLPFYLLFAIFACKVLLYNDIRHCKRRFYLQWRLLFVILYMRPIYDR